MAARKLVRDLAARVGTPDFNQAPFSLGAFNEISHNPNGKSGIAAEFSLGIAYRGTLLRCRFDNDRKQPSLSEWTFAFGGGQGVRAVRSATNEGWEVWGGDKEKKRFPGATIWSQLLVDDLLNQEKAGDRKKWEAFATELRGLEGSPPFAFAPIRAEPLRTYELTSSKPNPPGSHVPIVLSQIFGNAEWKTIEGPLTAFAKAAGLFEHLSVKKLAGEGPGPFQLLVKMGHSVRNIVDVGYGVSQIWPLAFELIRNKGVFPLYLVQQPEVHLHPRAQAALATLFGSLVKTQGKQFLIETHSDYLIDRVRLDVRDKKNIGPDDVVILYFERRKDGVKIFPIFLDELGNLLEVPPTYRRFFLEEERRQWGLP